jgi:hypothetical protein
MHNGNHVILWKRTTKAVQTYRVKLLEWPWDYLASERVLVLMLFAFSEGYYQGSNALRHSR